MPDIRPVVPVIAEKAVTAEPLHGEDSGPAAARGMASPLGIAAVACVA